MTIYNHKTKTIKVFKNLYLNQIQEVQLYGNKQQI